MTDTEAERSARLGAQGEEPAAAVQQMTEILGGWMQAAANLERYASELEDRNTTLDRSFSAALDDKLALQKCVMALQAENAALRAAYLRRTQLALAAGLVRFVVTGDAP